MPAMDWLNFHHLRYFWTAAREGSLRRAATKLNVSPPSVSAQIAELEEAVAAFLAEISLKVAALQDRYDPKAVAA